MDFIYGLLIGCPALGLLSRHWSTILVPLVGMPLYLIGKDEHWWGCCGTGDSWQIAAVVLTVVATTATALAVVLGRAISGVRGRNAARG